MMRVVNEYFTHLLCVFGGFWLGTQSQPGMYECWIKHSSNAVTKTLSSPVNHIKKEANQCAGQRNTSYDLNLSLWFTRCVVEELFRLYWSHVWRYIGYVVWVYGYGWGQRRSIPCISNIHLLSCYCLQVPSQPFSSSVDHILCCLLTPSVSGAAYMYLARKPAGTFWCMVHHTCFNHSVSQTPPRRGLLQHITEYTQLVI